jgi:hypothetical protein
MFKKFPKKVLPLSSGPLYPENEGGNSSDTSKNM